MTTPHSAWRLLVVSLLAVMANAQTAAPTVASVVNGASFAPQMSPGCLVSIFGTNLAAATVTASSVPLPQALGGVSVKIGGLTAPLYFVSGRQINAQVPFELSASNNNVPVVVTSAGVSSTPFSVRIGAVALALFTNASNGSGHGLYFDANFQLFDTALKPGSTVILYAAGLGQTSPPAATAAGGAAVAPLNRLTTPPDVYIGESKAQVAYAGLAPGFVGVYQLNVVVPANPVTSRILLVSGAQSSNAVTAVITSGANTKNVSGSIYPILPALGPASYSSCESAFQGTFNYSPIPLVVQFTAQFDIVAGAKQFTVAAVSEAGSSLIVVDPASGSITGASTSPTAETRAGVFSSSPIVPVDFAAGGTLFPNGAIPSARLDPYVVCTLNSIAYANTSDSTSPGTQQLVQTLNPYNVGSTVFLGIPAGDTTNLPSFAGWLNAPYAPYLPARTTTVLLFVDGSLVSTLDIPYTTSP